MNDFQNVERLSAEIDTTDDRRLLASLAGALALHAAAGDFAMLGASPDVMKYLRIWASVMERKGREPDRDVNELYREAITEARDGEAIAASIAADFERLRKRMS